MTAMAAALVTIAAGFAAIGAGSSAIASTVTCTTPPKFPVSQTPLLSPVAPLAPGTAGSTGPVTQRLISLINNSPCGATIYMAVYDLGTTSQTGAVESALESALGRGVTLYLVFESSNATGTNQQGAKLIKAITDANAGLRPGSGGYKICSGPCMNHTSGSVMHNKFALFNLTGLSSTPGTDTFVLWESTANYNNPSNGEPWNNAVVVRPATTSTGALASNALYQIFSQYWTNMWFNANSTTSYPNYYGWYTAAQRTDPSINTLASFTPEAPPGDFYDSDLASVNANTASGAGCNHPGSFGDGSGHSIVRVAMSGWEHSRGVAIVDRLEALATAGCTVYAVAGGRDNVTQTVVDELRKDKAANFHAYYYCNTSTSASTHMKEVLVGGAYAGASAQKVVLTGSENFGTLSLTGADNNMVQIKNDQGGVYTGYLSQFNSLMADPNVKPIGYNVSTCANPPS